MAQYDIDLRDYWRIIKKRRPIIIFSMVTMLIFSFFFAHYKRGQSTPIYSSTATIKIDQPMSRGMYTPFSNTDDIDTDVRTITTFPVMAKVAVRFGDLPDTLAAYPDSVKFAMIQSNPEWFTKVNNLMTLVYPQRDEYTNVVNITTQHMDPVSARDLAQQVAEVYRDYRRFEANQRIIRAIALLTSQSHEYEARLDSLKNELTEFKTNKTVDLSMAPVDIQRDIRQYTMLRDNSIDKKIRTQGIIDRLESNGKIDESAFSNQFAEEEGGIFRGDYQDLLDMQSELEELLQFMTPEHPDVKAKMASIDAQRNSLVKQLKGNLKAQDATRSTYDARLSKLRERLDSITLYQDSMSKIQENLRLTQEQYYTTQRNLSQYKMQGTEAVDVVKIISPADVIYQPINPPPSVFSISFIGLFLGTIIGMTAAFVFETLDTSIGTIEDVEAYLEVPVIGLIPQISADMLKSSMYNPDGGKKFDHEIDDEQAMLVIHYAPKSVLAESYRSLRTNIQFITHEKDANVLMFTSTSPNEGKTTSIVNLALTMAQSGNKVLLIDADLRRPSLDGLFGLERENGLSEIVLGKRYWKECVNTVADIITGELGMSEIILEPGIDNLHLITSGAIPPNPSELLNNDNMDEFIETVRKAYDIVLFDCTPTLPATDPAVLGRKVDGIIFVYAVGRVSRASLKRAKNQMDNVKANVFGVVLNGIRADLSEDFHDYKYKEYYYYSYTDEDIEMEQTRMGKIKKYISDFVNKFV